MSKHTQGPWTVDQRTTDIRDASGVTVVSTIWDHEVPDVVVDANARLIAAAPDLLDACRRALEDFGRYARGEIKASDAPDMLRAAIAKAEGGKP